MPRHPIAATPMAFVHAIVLAYDKYGIDPAAALRQAQVAPAQLRQADARVTAAQLEAISAYAMRELDDEALGWFSRRLRWGSYGMLSRASLAAPNLGVALKRWCRHHGLLTDDIALTLSAEGGVAAVRVAEAVALGPMREFCLVTMLRLLHGLACWLIASRIPLIEARFPFSAPPHRSAYPLMFPGPVHFEAGQPGFSFDARYLARPLRRDEPALAAMLKRPLPLIVLQYRRDRPLSQRVHQLLRQDAARFSTADALAEALHVSVRTLHRQLQDSGVSVQRLKDEVRQEQAIALLLRSARPVKQVALAVGFRNEKSFARAFKTWTGTAPEAYRQSRANEWCSDENSG